MTVTWVFIDSLITTTNLCISLPHCLLWNLHLSWKLISFNYDLMDLAIMLLLGEIIVSKPGQGSWIDIERTINIAVFLFLGFSFFFVPLICLVCFLFHSFLFYSFHLFILFVSSSTCSFLMGFPSASVITVRESTHSVQKSKQCGRREAVRCSWNSRAQVSSLIYCAS